MQFPKMILAVAAAVSTAMAQDLSQVPACALQPALAAIGATGCSLSDYKCICLSTSFINGVAQNLQSCTAAEVATTIQFAVQLCNSVGVTIAVPGSASVTGISTTINMMTTISAVRSASASASSSAATSSVSASAGTTAAAAATTTTSRAVSPTATTAAASSARYTGAAAELRAPWVAGGVLAGAVFVAAL